MRRRQTRILFNGAIFLALCATRPLAQGAPAQIDDTSAAREIARLDREFSAISVEKGMPAACVAYFAEDGIAFAPGAVNGRRYWSARKRWAGTLVWQPTFAAASRAGDLGYTTGLWELQKKDGAGSSGFGNYVTIWRKRSQWKIALDVGTDNPQPSQPPPPLQVLPSDLTVGQRSTSAARRSYRKAEVAFAEQAGQDIGKAILDFAALEVRILRDKSFPAAGFPAARILLGSEHARVVREVAATGLSSSGDLAYGYGSYSKQHGNVSDRGSYVTIWQVDLNGDWKILVDLEKKVEPAKP